MSVEIRFPMPGKPMSMNDREHWAAKASRTKDWRHAAALAARKVKPQPPSIVEVSIPFARNGRRDPHNYAPTVKAIVDGLVDAGLWPDDPPEFVRTFEPLCRVEKGGELIITITPRT